MKTSSTILFQLALGFIAASRIAGAPQAVPSDEVNVNLPKPQNSLLGSLSELQKGLDRRQESSAEGSDGLSQEDALKLLKDLAGESTPLSTRDGILSVSSESQNPAVKAIAQLANAVRRDEEHLSDRSGILSVSSESENPAVKAVEKLANGLGGSQARRDEQPSGNDFLTNTIGGGKVITPDGFKSVKSLSGGKRDGGDAADLLKNTLGDVADISNNNNYNVERRADSGNSPDVLSHTIGGGKVFDGSGFVPVHDAKSNLATNERSTDDDDPQKGLEYTIGQGKPLIPSFQRREGLLPELKNLADGLRKSGESAGAPATPKVGRDGLPDLYQKLSKGVNGLGQDLGSPPAPEIPSNANVKRDGLPELYEGLSKGVNGLGQALGAPPAPEIPLKGNQKRDGLPDLYKGLAGGASALGQALGAPPTPEIPTNANSKTERDGLPDLYKGLAGGASGLGQALGAPPTPEIPTRRDDNPLGSLFKASGLGYTLGAEGTALGATFGNYGDGSQGAQKHRRGDQSHGSSFIKRLSYNPASGGLSSGSGLGSQNPSGSESQSQPASSASSSAAAGAPTGQQGGDQSKGGGSPGLASASQYSPFGNLGGLSGGSGSDPSQAAGGSTGGAPQGAGGSSGASSLGGGALGGSSPFGGIPGTKREDKPTKGVNSDGTVFGLGGFGSGVPSGGQPEDPLGKSLGPLGAAGSDSGYSASDPGSSNPSSGISDPLGSSSGLSKRQDKIIAGEPSVKLGDQDLGKVLHQVTGGKVVRSEQGLVDGEPDLTVNKEKPSGALKKILSGLGGASKKRSMEKRVKRSA